MSPYLPKSLNRQSTIETNLYYWKKERHELLCAMSKVTMISPFPEECLEFQISLIHEFYDKIIYYITANHFGGCGLEELPINQLLINQILNTTKNILEFYDKYENLNNKQLDKFDIDSDLLIISEVLATHLDLEELLIANLLQVEQAIA